MLNKNIILTGLRGTGKTSIARALAKKLDAPCKDIDEEIVKIEGKKISEIVETGGWERFRKLEKEVSKRIAGLKGYIVSTGGGTFMDSGNSKALKKNGFVILLKTEIRVLCERIANEGDRPSLTGEKSSVYEMEDIWKTRKKIYLEIADSIIETGDKNVEEVANAIITILKEEKIIE